MMEGYLLLPPERGIIIGRAVWKPRFITLGPAAVRQPTTNDPLPRSVSSSRLQAARKGLKNATSKPNLIETLQTGSEEQIYLTVYKHQGDAEPLHRIPTSSIKSCEIQNMQYRKQGPAVPTLVVNLELDVAAEKLRRRRSSRAASLSVMNAPLEQLLFRTVYEEHYTINDWRARIQPYLLKEKAAEKSPMSPITPVSPAFNNFTNPFSPTRPSTGTTRPELLHRMSNLTFASTQSTRDRPSAVISPSPSLRSRRSDLSSQASSHPSHPAYTYKNSIPNTLPDDLPSPSYAFDDQSIEGWTVAQGRSSALSNHTRGSNSVASTPSIIPRESILDRALQMRSISITQQSEEEQSSIARFEAMMREIDERKNKGKSVSTSPNTDLTNDGDADDDTDDSENDDVLDDGDLAMAHSISTPAQRALEYISGRTTPLGRPMSPGSQRTHSMTNLGLQPRPRASRPRSMAPTTSNLPPAPSSPPPSTGGTSIQEKRMSSSSKESKRLSFNEFTRRLSSTSSLLLVQTNASLSSSSGSIERGSSEASFAGDDRDEFVNQKGLRHSNLGGPGAARERCGWRGSVGVFGGEGGFL